MIQASGLRAGARAGSRAARVGRRSRRSGGRRPRAASASDARSPQRDRGRRVPPRSARRCASRRWRARGGGARSGAPGTSARRSARAPRLRARRRTTRARANRPSASDGDEPRKRPLVGAAADALGARVHHAAQERASASSARTSQRTGSRRRRRPPQRAQVLEAAVGAVQRPVLERAVVDDSKSGASAGASALEVVGHHAQRSRPCAPSPRRASRPGRRAAARRSARRGARSASPRRSSAKTSERRRARARRPRQIMKLLVLVRADVEVAAGGPARRGTTADESERVAERRERLVRERDRRDPRTARGTDASAASRPYVDAGRVIDARDSRRRGERCSASTSRAAARRVEAARRTRSPRSARTRAPERGGAAPARSRRASRRIGAARSPRCARSASSVAPFASHSSIARAPRRRPRRRAGGAQRGGERQARVGVIEQRVGRRRDRDRGARELDRRGVLAAPRQRLGAHAAPGDRRLQVVARERLALVRQRLGLGDAILREQRARRAAPRPAPRRCRARDRAGRRRRRAGCARRRPRRLRAARRARRTRRPRAGAA